MKKPEKQTGGFAALYPTLASLIEDDRIWVEVGYTEMTASFIRVLDMGGMIWEGEHRYKNIDDALRAAEAAVLAWQEEERRMTMHWPMVPLGEVLTKSKDWIDLDPSHTYKEVTVRLWGKGVTQRGLVTGSEIAAGKRLRVHANQFIASRIDARNGAFGLIPEFLEGAVVTNDFPVFESNPARLLPRFLEWLSKTPAFVDLCIASSEGTTNRVRLKEDRFLAAQIPLPPLEEQRHIVARIEAVAAKVEEARGLRGQTVIETEAYIARQEIHIWDEIKAPRTELTKVTSFLARGRQTTQGQSSHFLIKTQHVQMGKLLRSSLMLDPVNAIKVLPNAIVQQEDILIACSAAGCLGRVAQYLGDYIASTDSHVAIARANKSLIYPKFLYAYLKSGRGQFELRSRERGDWQREKIGFRLTELNLSDLQKVPIPLPPLTHQRQVIVYLDGLQTKIDSLKKLQSETQRELDALLPSVLDKAFKGEL